MSAPRAALLGVVAVVAIAVAACGIPLDSGPREITEPDVRELAPTATTTSQPARDGEVARRVRYYFVRDGRLVDVNAQVTDPSIQQAVNLLLEGPTEDQADDGLTTSLPPGTDLLALRQRGGAVTLDLSSDMRNIGATSEKEAYAQLAYTVLADEDVNRVHFEIDGTRVAPPTDRGNVETVTRASYDPPLDPT